MILLTFVCLLSRSSTFSLSRRNLCARENGCGQSFATMPGVPVADDQPNGGYGQLLQAIQRELRPQGSHHRRQSPDAHLRRNPLPPRHS